MRLARPDDLVLLISSDHKRFIVRLAPGAHFHCHRGVVPHDEIIGHPTGQTVTSHNGSRFTVLRPSLEEVLMTLPRATQIVYPKDIGYILLKLSVTPGVTAIEAGCGSGILTAALARYVTPGGHLHSYETRPDMIALARSNLERLGLIDSVTFHERSVTDGFAQTDVDALFLDVREPWLYLRQAADALADGGFFGGIVPTVNQVIDLVAGLKRGPFADLEVSELLLRQYRAIPERVRPLDRLTAHTGFLVFARKSLGGAHVRQGAGDGAVDEDGEGVPDAAAEDDGEDVGDATAQEYGQGVAEAPAEDVGEESGEAR